MLSGYCHVLEDRIIFTPSEDLGLYRNEENLLKLRQRFAKVRGVLYPIFIFFCLLGFYFTVVDMIAGEVISSLFFLGLAIVLLRIILLFILSNPTLMIKKDEIISMKFRKEITWLGIWPMFILKFTKGNGKIGRKIIAMKYTLSEPGKEIAEWAIRIFEEEGLLNQTINL
jgi:hypothetical protein